MGVAGGWRRELEPKRLVPNLIAGTIVGFLAVVLSISLAVLIYGGELSEHLVDGIGLALLSTAIICTVVALFGSLPGAVATAQDAPAAVLAVAAAGIVAALPPSAGESGFVTVAATCAVATLVTALLMVLLGAFRLGNLVRYLPYPVVGGFLAGTGLLLFTGGVGVMTGVQPSVASLGRFLEPGLLPLWLPGMVFAVLILIVTSRADHVLVWPGLVLGAVALFYLVWLVSGASLASWREAGLLLGPFPDASLLRPIAYRTLGEVRWGLVAGQAGTVASVAFIALMSLLLNASGLELVTRRKIDLNRELRAAGLGNLLAGLAGGMVGYQVLSFSALSHRVGTGSRAASLTVAAVVVLSLVFGASLLAYLPTLVVGGMLAYLGLSFLLSWVWDAYFKLRRLEYAIVLLILLVIAAFGFLQGVAVGVVAAAILFVVSYGRAEVVKHALDGAAYQSRVSRGALERRYLAARGDELLILQLQGYLFFGTANGLLERIEARLEAPPPVRYLVLDFRQVTGLDATALMSFEKLMPLARQRGLIVVMSGLAPALARRLEQAGLDGDEREGARLARFATLDAALEWCEAQLLAAPEAVPAAPAPLEARLGDALSREWVARLLAYFDKTEVAAGHYLMRQGDAPGALYFVESGQVTARFEHQGQPPVRLETMRGGSLVGELGFYGGGSRTASVVADEPSTLYRLSSEALGRMTQEDPELAAAFHKLVVQLLAERVAHLMRVVEALQR